MYPLGEVETLGGPADHLGDGGGGQQLRVRGVAAIQQPLALAQTVGRVLRKKQELEGEDRVQPTNLEGHESLLGLGSDGGILALVQLLAQGLQPQHLLTGQCSAVSILCVQQ